MSRNRFICTLPYDDRVRIYTAVCSYLSDEFPEKSGSEVFRLANEAMDGRLVHLEDSIDLDALGL